MLNPAVRSFLSVQKIRRVVLALVLVGAVWFLLHTLIASVFGVRDDIVPSDAIIVFGNKVEVSGVPSVRLQARLDRALALYQDGFSDCIIVSGGFGKEGFDEALVMYNYLVAHGVPAAKIIQDSRGDDSYCTAKNCRSILQQNSMNSAILVSHYYHMLRARLAFRRFGVSTLGHACAQIGPERREPFTLVREFCAYYYYLLRTYEL